MKPNPDILALLAHIRSLYGPRFEASPSTAAAWHRVLGGYPLDLLLAAVDENGRGNAKYPPTCYELEELLTARAEGLIEDARSAGWTVRATGDQLTCTGGEHRAPIDRLRHFKRLVLAYLRARQTPPLLPPASSGQAETFAEIAAVAVPERLEPGEES